MKNQKWFDVTILNPSTGAEETHRNIPRESIFLNERCEIMAMLCFPDVQRLESYGDLVSFLRSKTAEPVPVPVHMIHETTWHPTQYHHVHE